MADGRAHAPDFARDPRSRADSSCPPARHTVRPNRVHSRLGLVFRLGLLSTCPRGHAVALGYLEVARCFKTQTFTGWFHRLISARTAGTCHRFLWQAGLVRVEVLVSGLCDVRLPDPEWLGGGTMGSDRAIE